MKNFDTAELRKEIEWVRFVFYFVPEFLQSDEEKSAGTPCKKLIFDNVKMLDLIENEEHTFKRK